MRRGETTPALRTAQDWYARPEILWGVDEWLGVAGGRVY
jgi:hypothetical protein